MENPSGQEQSSAEGQRPLGLEFAMGVALFAMISIAMMVVQLFAVYKGLVGMAPQIADIPFNLQWLDDPAVKEQLKAHNGDVTAVASFWSGLICLALIIASVMLWKRKEWRAFLGVRIPKLKDLLIWLAIFAGVIAAIELLARFFPVFHTDFMTDVLATVTNMPLLFVAVVIVGPLFEEFFMRGLLFGTLRHLVDEHVAIALTAGAFALMHMQYSSAILLLILPMSVVLGYARSRSKSIWVPVLLHMMNNALTFVVP